METDIKFNQLFESAPHTVYTLLHLPDPGPVSARSIEFKAVRTSADLVLEPVDKSLPARLVEFQGYRDTRFIPNVMLRCSLYRRRHPKRPVRCDIIYLRKDSECVPVDDDGLFVPRVHYLPDLVAAIEQTNPDSPIVCVMRSIVHDSADEISDKLHHDVQVIRQTNDLDAKQRAEWLDVMHCALVTKLNRPYMEIRNMLHGFLPNVEDTIWGKELKEEWTAEGKQEGIREGKQEGEIKRLNESIRSDRELLEQYDAMRSAGTMPDEIHTQVTRPLKDRLDALETELRMLEANRLERKSQAHC